MVDNTVEGNENWCRRDEGLDERERISESPRQEQCWRGKREVKMLAREDNSRVDEGNE